MGYERYPRDANQQGDYYGRQTQQNYGQDDGRGDARDRDRPSGGGWGDQERNRDRFTGGPGYYRDDEDRSTYGRDRQPEQGFGRDPYRQQRGTFDRRPQAHDGDRGFFERAGDEVRSWFGDEEAERRRERDAGAQGFGRDEHYHNWRNQQIAAFDRDYHEYRQENQSKFHNEFSSWRTERQGQRDLLGKVTAQMDVVGSDGQHVGTVDKVEGDRILLTKSDADAGGRHHSIPSRWLRSVDDKATLTKTADEAKQHWRDEERQGALFGDRDRGQTGERTERVDLNRSFSGTY